MFRTRLLSGIVLVILALVFIMSGGYVLWTVTLLLSLIGLMELYRVFGFHRSLPAAAGYAMVVLYDVLLVVKNEYQTEIDWMLYLVVLVMVFSAVLVFAYPRYHSTKIAQAIFGVLYVGVLFSFLYQTRMLTDGAYTVWLIFLSSWGCDTCAYCIGKLFGRHQMSPVLSPKKSVEGAVGGVVGTMLLTYIYATVFQTQMHLTYTQVWVLTVISAVGALLSMIGDLTASAIKRNFDTKDYGRLIPGHGGVLDRFDSVLFTAPVIYFLAYYLVR